MAVTDRLVTDIVEGAVHRAGQGEALDRFRTFEPEASDVRIKPETA
jgi:hypothetical protein